MCFAVVKSPFHFLTDSVELGILFGFLGVSLTLLVIDIIGRFFGGGFSTAFPYAVVVDLIPVVFFSRYIFRDFAELPGDIEYLTVFMIFIYIFFAMVVFSETLGMRICRLKVVVGGTDKSPNTVKSSAKFAAIVTGTYMGFAFSTYGIVFLITYILVSFTNGESAFESFSGMKIVNGSKRG